MFNKLKCLATAFLLFFQVEVEDVDPETNLLSFLRERSILP